MWNLQTDNIFIVLPLHAHPIPYKSRSLLYRIFVYNLTDKIACKFEAMIPAVALSHCSFTLSITHSLNTWSVEIEIHTPYEVAKLRCSVCLFVCKFDNGEIPSAADGGKQNTELPSYFSFNGQLTFELFFPHSRVSGKCPAFPSGIKTEKTCKRIL